MMAQMQRRTIMLATRLTLALLLVTLLGSTLALLTRKRQSLDEMFAYRTRIKNNLVLMRANSHALKEQIAAFHSQIRPTSQQRSVEMQLFLRLDQIKSALKPLEMNVTPVEIKDGAHTASFTLKLPLSTFESSINSMGRLQTEPFPFVIFKGASFTATPGPEFSVEGIVLMPTLPGGTL